jgi:hypothetical protein
MLFSKEIVKLLSDSPFKQFVLMELERERIYQSFVQIDDLDEISQVWLDFSQFCADTLSNVSSLSHLLYSRFLDEWTRDRVQIEADEERKEIITQKLEDLQEFQMELAILMIIYADIVNTGIFGTQPSPEYCTSYIEGYRILNTISQTYFDSSHPRASNIEEVMLTFLLLNQKQQIIQLLEESPNGYSEERLIEEKGAYELILAEFDVSFTAQFLKRLGEDWWWKDSIATHFAFERSLVHLETALDYYKKIPEDPELKGKQIETSHIALNQAQRNKELIDHYLRLSFEAAKSDSFIASVEYLNLVLGLEEEALKILDSDVEMIERTTSLKEGLKREGTIHSFFHGIAELAAKTSLLNNTIINEKKEDIQGIVDEIEEIVNKPDLKVNINYVSSLPFVYLNFVQELKIALLENIALTDAVSKAEQNLVRFIERLEYAINDISTQLIEIEKADTKIKLDEIQPLLENIDTIKISAYFLPKTEKKVYIVKDIECLEFLANSMYLEKNLAEKESNEVLDIIYHAKAHYYSTKALEISQLSSESNIDKEWVEHRYSQTFIQGQDVELRLFELTRQYLFLNTVIDKIAKGYRLSLSTEDSIKENYFAIINHNFNHFALFDIINERIAENCSELLNHKDMFDLKDSNINWSAIEIKKVLSEALTGFLEATKMSIFGIGADSSKENYKAASHFNDGAKAAKDASDQLQTISQYDSTFAQLAKSAYEFSILLKELERKTRESEKLQKLPIDELFNVLKQLTFLS